jgi:hypothetical protein
VLDADGRERFVRSTAAPTNECRAGALSPSGRKLALYRVSRGLVYGHADAKRDTTNVVEVWDVDAGRLEATVAVDAKLDRVGFDPTETRLLANLEYAQGPVAYELASGKRAWQIEDSYRTDRLNTCFSWAYAPDGGSLAVGGFGLRLLDGERRESTSLEGVERQRVYRAVFSRDGQLLASGGDQGHVFVRRV